MTTLPDWLVERVALDEVPPASRSRIDAADARELAVRIAALHAANAAELAAYPPGPAIAQITARADRRRADLRRRRRIALIGVASIACLLLVGGIVFRREGEQGEWVTERVKGNARVLAYKHVGDHAEPLGPDAVVRSGDLIQLVYNAAHQKHGVIASIDGAGAVTLHFPSDPSAPTALSPKPTRLPTSYELDDAPSYERFFFITSDSPLAVAGVLATLRTHAQRTDAATADLDLPAGLDQWSLRLRKPDKAPTP